MVVAGTALRPLATKVWRVASSRDRSESKTHQTERSRMRSVVTSSANGITQPHMCTVVGGEDATGSEVELNDLQLGKVVRAGCISISSERRSNNESLAVEDGSSQKRWSHAV